MHVCRRDTNVFVLDGEEEGFDPITLTGARSIRASRFGTADVGIGSCESTFPGAGAGKTLAFRVGALDLAGNFSGFSEPYTVTFDNAEDLPQPPVAQDDESDYRPSGIGDHANSCAAVPSIPSHPPALVGGILLFAILALGARRRR